MLTAVSNEIILATKQEFFFTKVTPVQSVTNTALLNFWLIPLSWIFISSYTTIYFFVKKFIVYISVNTIFECPYMFFSWEKSHPLSTYATDGWMGRVIQNAYNCVQGRGGCHVSCVPTYLHSLVSCFWQHFCLIVSCFICRNLTLSSFKKDMFVRNGYFSPARSISVVMK